MCGVCRSPTPFKLRPRAAWQHFLLERKNEIVSICCSRILSAFCGFPAFSRAHAQATGNSSSISGTVSDPTGAVVAGATVTIDNPVSGYHGSVVSDGSGNFTFANVPYNPYHMTVTSQNFAPYAQDVDVRSAVPVSVKGLRSSLLEPPHRSRWRQARRPDRNRLDRAHCRHRPPALHRSPARKARVLVGPARSSHRLRPASPQIPTVCSTASATTRKIHSRLTASPSPISRARSSRIKSRSIRFSRSK